MNDGLQALLTGSVMVLIEFEKPGRAVLLLPLPLPVLRERAGVRVFDFDEKLVDERQEPSPPEYRERGEECAVRLHQVSEARFATRAPQAGTLTVGASITVVLKSPND